ncbi:transcriptional regulator, partial [Streptomyces sp. NPDC001941]|uniref:AfsR/SARP family transcriptional regulator n=1 Tax=Streptomyces sp. NPDC001941 TaxID=3154659 RepID=UPI00331B8AE8
MEFRLLGGVGAGTGAGELPLGPAKRRSVLAALLLRRNTAVPVDQLIDAVWEEEPPAHARTVVQGHVSRLRVLFSQADVDRYEVRLATHGSAYVLEMPDGLLDVHRFEDLVRRGRHETCPERVVALLRRALAVWRGPALTGTAPSASLRAAAQALEETRLSTVERLADAYAGLGELPQAEALLRAEAVTHPLRESLTAALMATLYRAGRQSEALDHYHRTRSLLADELGICPGPALRACYEGILRGDLPVAHPPAVTAVRNGPPEDTHPRPRGAAGEAARGAASDAVREARGPDRDPGATTPVPPTGPRDRAPDEHRSVSRLLPRAARGFHGRDEELAALDRAASETGLALVTGAAGVGKTALALRWAHRRQERYPDGTLFADLRGFGDEPVQPDDVVREFLVALGVRPRALPETAVGAAALYRELTRDRALLVVLDNARGVDQVRPLLPCGEGSATLVTSRLRLSGLVVDELARPVALGLLGSGDAVRLLASAVGGGRVEAEPDAAARIGELCDGLPLALRITAAQLATRPDWRLADLADELADEQGRLALLSLEDGEGCGVGAALRLTVQGLPEDAARLFALLGAAPGPDVDRYAAAALAGGTPDAVALALSRLTGAHLVTEYTPGRYSLHDLVRLYARALPRDEGALLRFLDHCTVTALAAAGASAPDDRPCCLPPADTQWPAVTRDFTGRDDALRWYAAERENLAAAVEAARAAGHDDRAWRLAALQWPYITWHVRDDWAPLLEQALDAATAVGDLDAEARLRALLGWVLLEEDRLPEALVHLERAPVLAARAGDPSSEATALVNLARAMDRGGVTGASIAHVARAAELASSSGDSLTELLALELRARQLLSTGAAAAAERCAAYGLGLLDGHGGLAPGQPQHHAAHGGEA